MHRKNSLRLGGFDYSQPGFYFVTFVTKYREPLFGQIHHGEMEYTRAGNIAYEQWEILPAKFPFIVLDGFVVMPNHLHGILIIHEDMDRQVGEKHSEPMNPVEMRRSSECFSPTINPYDFESHKDGTRSHSLGAIIQNYKSITARKVNAYLQTPGANIWQRNYYDRIIRNQDELEKIREYILNNPSRWDEDGENQPHE